MESAAPPSPGIEEVLARLEAIVSRLERPEIPLEEAMALYAEGVRLSRSTGERLAAAELRISELRASLDPPSEPS